eukprot:2280924-Amphidinium_carterae.1
MDMKEQVPSVLPMSQGHMLLLAFKGRQEVRWDLHHVMHRSHLGLSRHKCCQIQGERPSFETCQAPSHLQCQTQAGGS